MSLFAEGFKSLSFLEDCATFEVFQKAVTGKNGRKRYCHAVKVLIRRAKILPDKEQECTQFLIEIARQCGTKNVIDALTNFGIKHHSTKDLCIRLVAEVCFAS